METIKNITNNVFDSILPVYGNQRANLPIWNESQKMFITSEYESASGNRYYKGIRFSERLVIIEKWDSTIPGPISMTLSYILLMVASL